MRITVNETPQKSKIDKKCIYIVLKPNNYKNI